MENLQILSRNEMKNIIAGYIVDEYGCTYTGSRSSCRSYYDCLTGVCTASASEEGWSATDCVVEVQTLRSQC